MQANDVTRGRALAAAGIMLASILTGVGPMAASAVEADEVPAEPVHAIPPDDRSAALGDGYTDSDDVLLHTVGDARGLHVMIARERDGYQWRTLATLGEPSIETDRWIGNVCMTPDSRYVAASYAPRSASSRPELLQRGAFAAVIEVATGNFRELPFGTTIAHYNPGCGVGHQVAFSKYTDMDDGPADTQTRVDVVEAPTAKVVRSWDVAGQLASVVPSGSGAVAVRGMSLVQLSGEKPKVIAETRGVPSRLTAVGGDSVAYLERNGTDATARLVSKLTSVPATREIARGANGDLTLVAGANGKALVVGDARKRSDANGLKRIESDTIPLTVSTRGHALLFGRVNPAPYAGGSGSRPSEAWIRNMTSSPTGDPTIPQPEFVTLTAVESGESFPMTLEPDSPATRTGAASTSLAGDTTTSTIDADTPCAVPRNDPRTQVYQPTARQVEWAADQAVVGNLKVSRTANWKQSGLTKSWTPQGLIPLRPLSGGGRVPVQALLGILAQESNLWQASGHSLPGIPGNPLVSNFYGTDGRFGIDWSEADCGYGVAQVTDGMRKDGPRSAFEQRAIVMDYATNIAAGLDILIQKWNQTRAAGLVHDNGKPESLENWVFALWAYNSGFHAKEGDGEPWGVGWANNPANPIYDEFRHPFLRSPSDAAHPQDWPYQEKVIGFASYSIATYEGPGFRPAWWVDDASRDAAKPDIYAFCKPAMGCYPSEDFGDPGPCGHRDSTGSLDYKCWWNEPTSYHACGNGYCGHELMRFDTSYKEQPDGTNNPPNCSRTGLPSGALVVDDLPTGTPAVTTSVRKCGSIGTSVGTFTLTMAEQSPGKSSARIDMHQSGAGFGGHVWWAHTRSAPRYGYDMDVSGTWAFNSSLAKWGRVLVHVPDYAAHTQQAKYVVDDGTGKTYTRFALQRTRKNGWISLGAIKFNGRPRITLSSHTEDGTGDDDIAWDAVAIQPLSAKPRNMVVVLGDSYTSGEGASNEVTGDPGSDYYKETDFGGQLTDTGGRNACHRSKLAWSRKLKLKDKPLSTLGARADSWDATLDLQFHACSGAETQNVNDSTAGPNAFGRQPVGQFGEISQLEKGYLSADTTLIMLSIGGNDAGFGPTIKNCFIVLSCESNDSDVQAVIRGPMRSSVAQTLERVHALAPNASIVLVGYPKLFSAVCSSLQLADFAGLDTEEIAWMNGVAGGTMRSTLISIVDEIRTSGVKIAFADPISDFEGRGACGNPEHVRSVVLKQTASDNSWLGIFPSTQSFHPNPTGTTTYATAVSRAVKSLGF